jgi:FixJ family two-component response regulator
MALTTTAPPTVFIVDDEVTVATALARVLKAAGFEVETFDSSEAFVNRLPLKGPACLLLDQNMPGMSGLELQRLVGETQALRIVFMTGHADVTTPIEALKAGAADFLLKPIDGTQLVRIVGRCLDESAHVIEEQRQHAELGARLARLTPRERQVCDLVASGLPNKQIAAALGASEKTIKIHRSRMMRKMGVDSVAQLARLVERSGDGENEPASAHSEPSTKR